MVPSLEERLVNSSDEETRMIADLVSDIESLNYIILQM